MDSLTFDPETHTYRRDGVLVPNVTSIIDCLPDYSMVAAEVMEHAANLGDAVHAATELDDQDDLDEESVHPMVMPYLEAWRRFRADTGFEPEAIEARVYHPRHNYAGTLDRVGRLNGAKVVLDIKSGVVGAWVGVQTAAYQEAWNWRRAEKATARFSVQLKRDGTYRLHPYRDPSDWSVFLACKTLHDWRKRHGNGRTT